MKESQFLNWITQVAEFHSWRWWHVPTPMRPVAGGKFVPDSRGRGLPDLILMRDDPPQIIFAEVKNETGGISPEQREFLNLARGISDKLKAIDAEIPGPWMAPPNVQAFLWRPAHRDLIEAVLSAK